MYVYRIQEVLILIISTNTCARGSALIGGMGGGGWDRGRWVGQGEVGGTGGGRWGHPQGAKCMAAWL